MGYCDSFEDIKFCLSTLLFLLNSDGFQYTGKLFLHLIMSNNNDH